ncbi:MAG: hypothetical protein Q9181_001591 [Wetmoreana brouardii]
MDIFRVRLNCVDHYQGTSTEFDPQLPGRSRQTQQKNATKVPVIRVFGATETGQKVCAHIHGAFPYLYIEYHGSLIPDDVDAYIHRLHLSIDHALAVSYRRNMYDGKTAFVAHISLVKGIPFYGYHVGYKFFLKIYTLNPLHMTRLADLLRQGAIMKKVLQPYESHMQYLLQWMCDYNIYGCAYIDCSEVRFRAPIPDHEDIGTITHHWHDQTISPSMVLDEEKLPRQSHCSLEVDICVQHILNRLDVKSRPLHHDFVERQQSFAHDEKLVHSMAGLWRDETRRRKTRMGLTDPGSSPFPTDVLVSVSADPRNTQPGGWIHEEEYREKIDVIVRDERVKSDGSKLKFDSFVKKTSFESFVKTSLEAVEDLFPDNLAKISSQKASQTESSKEIPVFDEADVDVSRALSFREDDFQYESDEEIAREMEMSQRRQGDMVDECLADDGIGEAEKADEVKLDRTSATVNTNSAEERALAPSGDSRDPKSSSELAEMGIRDVADNVRLEEDDFEIPTEFASDITTAKNRYEKRKRPPSKSGLSNKSQKFCHGDRPFNRDSIDSGSTGQTNGFHQHDSATVIEEPHPLTADAHELKASQTDSESNVPSQRTRRYQTLGPASQEKMGNRVNGNRTLTFPIVKDPQDPNTILRLSQRSHSPKKSPTRDFEAARYSSSDRSKDTTSSASKGSQTLTTEATPERPVVSSQIMKLSSQIRHGFCIAPEKQILCFAHGPPAASDLMSDLGKTKKPPVIYQDAYYSDHNDVPERGREYAGKEFKIESNTVSYLPVFDPTGNSPATFGEKPPIVVDKLSEEKHYHHIMSECSLRSWEIAEAPPSRSEVQQWLDEGQQDSNGDIQTPTKETQPGSKQDLSQVEAATQKNQHGFKYSQKQKSTSVQHETQYMSTMSLELHVNTRGNLVPNPEHDEISCGFWCIQGDYENLELNGRNEGTHVGILALSGERGLACKISHHSNAEVEEEDTELDLINRMVDIVREHDPDILTGYEVHGGSWGYMIERGRCQYDYNLCDEFSRMKSQSHGRFGKENDRWGFNHTSTIRVTGRHMINIWRAMRGELNLLQYTMENVVFHLLHQRVPHYSYQDLTRWYKSDKPKDLARVVDYYVSRVQLDLEILEQNDLVPRTSEQARLLGVDFFSVFSRGSQFKVESLMFRIAKPENFLLPSPSRKQVGQQNALECLPLVMEPQSAFYNSPLLVLDFQSLYPSVMIAYNYCYSTFLGRVVSWRGQNKMGFTDYQRDPRLIELFKNHINVAPNGMMYVKPDMRKSLLAKMLGEILETRVMVKSGMKVDKDDKTLQRLLNNRQLALKLIANVTYGYTSASFSGRMPCSEIADSIVQSGRETLEKAIALIHSVEKWGAEVVYGDTDSLFVYLKGRTKDEAFVIGEEIAKTVTDMNPRPVKLKFEKVYFPCVLLAKKRYVGFKYESKAQQEPDFDAKGIETVRRDGTPAEQKIEEKALKILFRTSDLSQVKKYFQRQCTKIMKGKVSIQDFCFAKEVKLGTYSDKGPPPPGALISTRRMLEDPRAEPQYGERVPYVVITGAPGARLIDRCVAPDVLLHNDHNELDAEYYISKNLIPPLERIFNLVGANVRQWYDEMPKFQRIRRIDIDSLAKSKELIVSKKTLESYMKSSACVICREKLEEESPICNRCMAKAHTSLLTLRSRQAQAEQKAVNLEKVCRSCAGLAWGDEVRCDSKDCPVFYTRARHLASLRTATAVANPVMNVLEAAGGGYVSLQFPPNLFMRLRRHHDEMGAFSFYLCIYILGGLTFLPLLFILVLLHAHLTFPRVAQGVQAPKDEPDSLEDTKDDGQNIKSSAALAALKERFQSGHEPDVAAGYFAVCRDYVPGGVNGKPPERTTPAGAVVATESPSVYQSMYRSIFDRKQGPTLDAGKGNAKPTKRARNVFYVVLRHGHLMLYDDIEQVEVRHVISLEHHNVSIYGGEEEIPEGELWIKRNAICLSRKSNLEDIISTSKPFYLFSENCSEKEDFYFALLHNQEVKPGDVASPPRPLQFETKDVITLVQQLHSSEEQLQTRWVNALTGRLFLALYKTPEIEDLIRKKITKKVARVKKPAFLSGIILRKIDMGESAPYITNPRLKDLTIDGDCCVEADVKYRGNFRLEIATTARIDLGARFRVREVDLVLAAVVKRLEGHVLVKLKPPPSNRIWITFETTPDMELSIEPVVSSRQITYNVILRAIESRIREVIAETIVLPHWDDSPFLDTSHQHFRGGIWRQDPGSMNPGSKHTAVPDEAAEDEGETSIDRASLPATTARSQDERTMSMPVLSESTSPPATPRKAATSEHDTLNGAELDRAGGGISSSMQKPSGPPKAIRSRSFASAADPLISMDHANVTSPKSESKNTQHADATSAMKAISHKSRPTSPMDASTGHPLPESPSLVDSKIKINLLESYERQVMNSSPVPLSSPPSPTSTQSNKSIDKNSRGSATPSRVSTQSSSSYEKKQSIGSISAATAAAAKSWGWNVLYRAKDHRQPHGMGGAGTPESPIGRGRPLPPPGQPLPLPEKPSTKVAHNGSTRRKPVPSPVSTPRRQSEASVRSEKPPPLPSRRRQPSTSDDINGYESILVVEKPSESQPSSPQHDDRKENAMSPVDDRKGDESKPDQRSDVETTEMNGNRASVESTRSSDTASRDEESKASSLG